MKKLLCIVAKSPFAGSTVIEQLEAAMVGAVFEFDVSILFIGEGISCLRANQDGGDLGVRTAGNVILALETYEVNHIYACDQALASLGATPSISVLPLAVAEQASLIAQQDIILGGAR